jgi:hypothetical protein
VEKAAWERDEVVLVTGRWVLKKWAVGGGAQFRVLTLPALIGRILRAC